MITRFIISKLHQIFYKLLSYSGLQGFNPENGGNICETMISSQHGFTSQKNDTHHFYGSQAQKRNLSSEQNVSDKRSGFVLHQDGS
jgi:hypothetical protein